MESRQVSTGCYFFVFTLFVSLFVLNVVAICQAAAVLSNFVSLQQPLVLRAWLWEACLARLWPSGVPLAATPDQPQHVPLPATPAQPQLNRLPGTFAQPPPPLNLPLTLAQSLSLFGLLLLSLAQGPLVG